MNEANSRLVRRLLGAALLMTVVGLTTCGTLKQAFGAVLAAPVARSAPPAIPADG